MKSLILGFALFLASTAFVAGVSRAESQPVVTVSAFQNCVAEQRYAGLTQERAEANCSTPDPSQVRPTMSRPATAFEVCVAGSMDEGDSQSDAEANCL